MSLLNLKLTRVFNVAARLEGREGQVEAGRGQVVRGGPGEGEPLCHAEVIPCLSFH